MPGLMYPADTVGKTRRQRRLSVWLALVFAICLNPTVAPSDDHDNARRLRETGEILPLQEVLRRHRRAIGPRVLEVELDKRRGRYVYQVESLDRRGKVKRHYFDATTGEHLRAKQRN